MALVGMTPHKRRFDGLTTNGMGGSEYP